MSLPLDLSAPRDANGPKSGLRKLSGRFARARPWLAAAAIALAAGEVAARLDDRLFADTPLLANPDRARDLLVQETWGFRGRPNGAYKRWQLNSFGFSGPEIAELPAGRRIMVLGASETFGLYESKGKDYPAQLAAELVRRRRGDIEVVNAGVAGMTLPSLTVYWQQWASRFKPDTVLVYPSAHFYLDAQVPRAPQGPQNAEPLARTDLPSRFAMRLRDHLRQTSVVKAARAWLAVRSETQGKGPEHLFASAPTDRVAAFAADVEQLGEAIERSGARPVLLTHAFKMAGALSAADRAELEAFRVFFPRALPEAFPAFAAAAREAVIAVGQRRRWIVVDVAGTLSGRRHLFADPVHLTDEGSRLMAATLADALALSGLLNQAEGR
jgi:lysophospholipase L1-like esterase